MNKNILVLGGTKFFGKKTVKLLLEKGYQVTIATRGNTPHPFGDKVDHIILDARDGFHEGWREVTSHSWHAVFDNVCYTKEDARLIIEKLQGNMEQLFFTSSMAVYQGDKDGYEESDFDPFTYTIDPGKQVTYGEGKRQAETIFYNEAPFPVTSFRLPIVLDTDDYTERLLHYVEKGVNEETIRFQYSDVLVNYVMGSEAAEAIVWLIENEKEGIFNISSRDAIPVQTFIQWLEEGVGKPIQVVYSGQPEPDSPFSVKHDQYLVSDKLIREGFELSTLEEWLKPLIRELREQVENK